MKIKQKKTDFSPITIKLETREEAEAFWDFIESTYINEPKGSIIRKLLCDISNTFTNLHW